VGLTTILLGRATLDDVVQHGARPSLRAPRRRSPRTHELLGSAAMEPCSRVPRGFYFVIVTARPSSPVIDPVLINRRVGGLLLVAPSKPHEETGLTHALRSSPP
jgi:hypothetical protein